MKQIKGVVAGNFDVLHPGYINMFKDCYNKCTSLVVLLHEDPSLERPHKKKPVLSVEERKNALLALRYVDDVVSYRYESTLHDLLKMGEFDIRFLGDDYINKPFTGDELKIEIYTINRDHGWSTTKFKQLIAESI